MRFIFVDEAGTSAHEPVTVVVGIIASADAHVMRAERLVKEMLGAVPPAFETDFVFHATEILAGNKYQSRWSLTDRLRLMEEMMSVPLKIGMAITVCATWKNSVDHTERAKALRLTPAQWEHMLTFGMCLAVADRNIRKYAGPNEVAAVVAEDVPELRRHLKGILAVLRSSPIHLQRESLRQTPADREAGYCVQSGELRIARIRTAVHFVEKAEDPLVQVADACAFGFRRYFAGQERGVRFVRAILGTERRLRNFAPPSGAECWWP